MPEDLRVLQAMVKATRSSAPWNEYSLPRRDRDLCCVFVWHPPLEPVPEGVTVVAGDGTLRGGLRAAAEAMRHDPDVVHVHHPSLALAFWAVARLRQWRGKLLVTAHNTWSSFRFDTRLLWWGAAVVSDMIVTCSRAALPGFQATVGHLPWVRLEAVDNGVDLGRLDAAAPEGFSEAAATGPDAVDLPTAEAEEPGGTMLTVARLVPIKDHDTALRALATVPGGWLLEIIGGGPRQDELQALARELGFGDRVVFRGIVPREEVYATLWRDAAGVFVSASRGEGLPVSVLEGMATGKVPVLSDIAPHRALLPEGYEWLLFQPGSVEACAAVMRRVVGMSAGERKALGAVLASYVRGRFTLAAMHEGYDRIYDTIMSSTSATGRCPGRR